MQTEFTVRPAIAGDIEQIRDVEVAAGQLFKDVGLPAVADDPPPARRLLRHALRDELLWVAVATSTPGNPVNTPGPVIGYGFGSVLDEHLHLEQISVRPQYSRRGIGANIFRAMEDYGLNQDLAMATLFTFGDIPWNAPYYRRLNYLDLEKQKMGPQLRRAFELERIADGNGPPRIAMFKALG